MADPRPDNMATGDRLTAVPADFPAWLQKRLEWFSDLKFGLFVHWGIYSQWGCTESWPLVPDDTWARDPQLPAWIDAGGDIAVFQERYRALNRSFNPRQFNPDAWVEAAQAAEMRYFNFTTKHHDGFCMFDTQTTNYRITHADCPFHDHPYANVTKALFERFQAAGLAISCYFSKSDWHCPWYWSREPGDPTPTTRNPNYDTRQHPERWARFVDFTHQQIQELMTDYGPIDMLWLDGGQVRPPEQDIDMDRLVDLVRAQQPQLLVVDRTVGGPHENILTPEQQVPDAPLPHIWETCLTLGSSFSYKPNDEYKSARETIALLVDIVSKGGNLLLGVGADQHGCLPDDAVSRLREVGDWLRVNGEAIFETRGTLPFAQSDETLELRYTRKGRALYAIILAKPMQQRPPREITLRGVRPAPGSAARLLGVEESVTWEQRGADAVLTLPTSQLDREEAKPAWVVRLTACVE